MIIHVLNEVSSEFQSVFGIEWSRTQERGSVTCCFEVLHSLIVLEQSDAMPCHSSDERAIFLLGLLRRLDHTWASESTEWTRCAFVYPGELLVLLRPVTESISQDRMIVVYRFFSIHWSAGGSFAG